MFERLRCSLGSASIATAVVVLLLGSAAWLTHAVAATPVTGIFPYGLPNPSNPDDYPAYLFIQSGDCSKGAKSVNDLPPGFDCVGSVKFSDYRDPSRLLLGQSAQELYGVEGAATNRAWEVSTGRPDVTIAVTDSGVEWNEKLPALRNKIHLNRGELPRPVCAGGQTGNPADTRFGGYDCNGDGVFNVADYAHDGRVSDLNGNGVLDPEDLIMAFTDGADDDHNGYVDDIAGWDFYDNDNDPFDDTQYGHGSGEMRDSSSAAGLGEGGQCPNCMVMMLRVGDSFVADVNHYAQAVIYAVDNGVNVLQEALGTINHTSFGAIANRYAFTHGVLVVSSMADEAAAHHMWPAAYGDNMVVNSIRSPSLPVDLPFSYLYLNGCTNFGGYAFVSIPSHSCSSEATGRSAGVDGLLVSAAKNAVERGDMTPYIRDDGSVASYPLSPAEQKQLWRLAADDIDFSTPCPQHAGCSDAPNGQAGSGLPNNFLTLFPIPTSRYQTERGWDFFTGYGRANNGRLLRMIGIDGDASRVYGDAALTAQDRIPPEAHIVSPSWWTQFAYTSDQTLLDPGSNGDAMSIVVQAHLAANRVTRAGGSFDWVLEWAPGGQAQPWPQGMNPAPGSGELSGGPWTVAASGTGLTHAVDGVIGRIPIASIVAAQAGNPYPFNPDPTSPFKPEQYDVRLRVRVIAHPVNSSDTVNNEAVTQRQVSVYPATETLLHDNLGVDGRRAGGSPSPVFADLDGDGRDELIIASDDGLVHAYTDVATGQELPGWPVHTLPLASIPKGGSNAFTRGDVPGTVYTGILVGSPAVADLDEDGNNEVIVGDLDGNVYAWNPDGTLHHGFPVHVDRSISRPAPCTPATIPDCGSRAWNGSERKRDPYNRRNDWFVAQPSVGKLDEHYPGLDIVAGAGDGHVYAWHADGTPVPGWPVVLRDPATVATMDPNTQFYTFKSGVEAKEQGMIVTTPSLGDVNDDGHLNVVSTANEEYVEAPNMAPLPTGVVVNVAQQTGFLEVGNTRLYVLHHDGTLHPRDAADVDADAAASANYEANAYLKGWPVKMALVDVGLLPDVGEGSNAPPALVDLDGDGQLEIVGSSVAGAAYVFKPDGSSYLGTQGGVDNTLDELPVKLDTPSFSAIGALSVGSIDGGGHISIAGAAGGLQRVLDLALVGNQTLGQDQLALWNAKTGLYEPFAPIQVNDLQFFTQPIIADVTGDGRGDVIQGSAVNDTVIVSQTALLGVPAVTRLYSGGFTVSSAAVGIAPLGTPQKSLSMVTTTREGYLRIYPTQTPIDGKLNCTALSQWPKYAHDLHNSGNYQTDARRPGPLRDVTATAADDGGVQFSFTATGDDAGCGRADHYELRRADTTTMDWNDAQKVGNFNVTAAAGAADGFSITASPNGNDVYLLRAFDEAGNGSAVSRVRAGGGGGGSSGGGSGGSGGGASGGSSGGGTTPPPSGPLGGAGGGGGTVSPCLILLLMMGGVALRRRWRQRGRRGR